ncbi:hypothetical protein AB0758_00685 [Tolypothrix bouteillei VB521301_2]|uniref:hypothetical protein n=1 Tax=Tolypothrix bouteillei TaxID=1246981 RepID=UPI0038B49BAF
MPGLNRVVDPKLQAAMALSAAFSIQQRNSASGHSKYCSSHRSAINCQPLLS